MALIVQADLEGKIGAAEVARYSRGVAGNITSAIAEAESAARSAALNLYTPESWDAMTSSSIPADAKASITWDAIERLSAGSSRPDYIDKKGEEASSWRARVVLDRERGFDLILVRNEVRADGAGAFAQLGKNYLHRTDGESYLGLPELP